MARSDDSAADMEPTAADEQAGSYVTVTPTDDPLSATTVQSQFERLRRLDHIENDRPWYRGLLSGGPEPPTIECLLVSRGGTDATVEYHFGVDNGNPDALERALRELFPDSYEFERTGLDLTAACDPSGAAPDTTPRDWSWYVAGVEFQGRAERRNDWQTRLTPFETFQAESSNRVPLAAVLETMAETAVPMVYQALLQPEADWTPVADARHTRLELARDTRAARISEAIDRALNPELYEDRTIEDISPAPSDQQRLEELDAKATRRSFAVNARAAAITREQPRVAEKAVADLTAALSPVSKTTYDIEAAVHTDDELHTGASPPGYRVFEAIRDRTFRPPDYERRATQLPWKANTSHGIVADVAEAPSFCLLGGEALTTTGTRALATTPGERTALPRPPDEQLAVYRTPGLTVGRAQTQDGTVGDPLAVPPQLQRLHVGWIGKTGSGKSTSLTAGMLDNHAATAGADILIDPKGDGMATDYLRSHYARFGTLENVYYFDCSSVLPAFSFFDIRDELDAGISRTAAVEDKVDHYLDILTQIMGADRFGQAVRSPDVIRYLLKAQFDPVHGDDAFAHRRLHEAARRMHDRQAAPAVSDPDLERMLSGVAANQQRSFDEIMQGVANRIEKVPVDRRLARVFNHVPNGDDPAFDLADVLDEDAVVVFDTGGLRSEAQRVLTLVVLSNLWTALKRRSRRGPDDADHPLVNLYLEEAASVAVSELLSELLAQARGFDCSVTLSMQFPAQLRETDAGAYDELLNNVSTVVTGNVPVDRQLTRRLATDDMDPAAVGNRLRALERGQWLARLPAEFDEPEPRPFVVRSASPPAGHPASDQPLDEATQQAFADATAALRTRTRAEYGLTIDSPDVATDDGETAAAHDRQAETADAGLGRVDTALPHTKRLPTAIEYDADSHALHCGGCGNRYDPTSDGVRRAIACCHDLAAVDRADIPICDINLKLTREERAATEQTDRQLIFLQAVYNAQQLRYDSAVEYDLTRDSMLRLQEYVGIDTEAVQELLGTDLLRHDTDHPHRLFSVTADGRQLLGEGYRRGLDYGHGQGDLEESSQHVFAVEVARRYLDREYARDPESAVVAVQPYYDIDEQRRLDLAGLDADGEIVITVEAERINHDIREAVPSDFDKMAECDPDEALWIVMTRGGGHQVLAALNEPPDGEPRVEKTYSENTPPQQFRIDTPGLSAIYPVEYLRESLDDDA
jgi:DNA helicase HerA-like ATPase